MKQLPEPFLDGQVEITPLWPSTNGILTMVSLGIAVLPITGCILLGYKVRKLYISFMLLQALQQALQQTSQQVLANIVIDIHVYNVVITKNMRRILGVTNLGLHFLYNIQIPVTELSLPQLTPLNREINKLPCALVIVNYSIMDMFLNAKQ